jgi:hypothetical protein
MSRGVPAGATNEFQPSTAASMPLSRSVGTSGSCGERLLPDEATARICLASIGDLADHERDQYARRSEKHDSPLEFPPLPSPNTAGQSIDPTFTR